MYEVLLQMFWTSVSSGDGLNGDGEATSPQCVFDQKVQLLAPQLWVGALWKVR
jgi:hypothetical protein